MKLHLEVLNFDVEDMGGPRTELELMQREKGKWLKPKKAPCPAYVVYVMKKR